MDGRLKTKAGEVYIRAISRDTVYVDTGACNEPGFTGLTLHGVQYYASAHLVQEGGKWELNTLDNEKTRLYLSRAGFWDATLAARKKARQVLIEAVTEWADKNPRAFKEAEIERLEREITNRGEQVKKLNDEADVLGKEIYGLTQELIAAKG